MLHVSQWVRVGGFSFFYGNHRGCLINPIFSNFDLCTVLGFTGGKYYQKITSPIFRFILQNLATVDFLIFFSIAIFSLTFFRLVCYCNMWLYFS